MLLYTPGSPGHLEVVMVAAILIIVGICGAGLGGWRLFDEVGCVQTSLCQLIAEPQVSDKGAMIIVLCSFLLLGVGVGLTMRSKAE